MLDIYILEHNIKLLCHLKDICLRYLMIKDPEADIFEFSDALIPASAALYILEMCSSTEMLSRRLRGIKETLNKSFLPPAETLSIKQIQGFPHSAKRLLRIIQCFLNSGSYIVVRLNDYTELAKAVTPGICPSGVLVSPCERDAVEAVLDEIYADHIRCTAENIRLGMFCFKQKARELSVPFEKILLFESRNKKVLIRTEAQEFEVYETLDSILKRSPDCFMQIHKSFVINLTRVVSADFGSMEVELDDGSAAYISRTYKAELRDRLKNGSGKKCSRHT